MRRGIVVALAGVFVLIGVCIAYYRSQAVARRHISPAFRKAARYALNLVESYDGVRRDVTEADVTKAIAEADSARVNKADDRAMLVLGEYNYKRTQYREHDRPESERQIYIACLNAAHLLIELDQEVTDEVSEPCLAELRKQVQELRKQQQSRNR